MPLAPTPDQPKYDYASATNADLVWISDLDSSRKLVKAHVARSTHARARRKRMVEYQRVTVQQNQQGEGSSTRVELDFQESTPSCLTLADYTVNDVNRHYRDISRTCAPFGSRTSNSLVSLMPSPYTDRDLFNYLPGPIPEFESFLLNHYIYAIVKKSSGGRFTSYENAALRDWLPFAIADPGMRMGILLCASQSLHVRTGALRYRRCALRYKMACLRILGNAIRPILGTTDSPFTAKIDDATISIALQLASDEFVLGDSVAWESHINGIGEMIKLNGGLDNIKGMNGFLRLMLEVLAFKHQRRMISTARSDVNDISKLYRLEYFFGNDFAESLYRYYSAKESANEIHLGWSG
ncbi:uncharacterized protein F4807DRAFT_325411 [Annulohypoxylon truncatum]|uniref:uncharacterized protein n=1 Tax=Annulohypoxylon truncatum TaxID=327061 RepID=UPI002008B3C7|nr:uncharacterized protein F4807DRAFT_325411 [Annulohypoxylon truncatum]KAI1204689.1 hypothetical protein F4807DRAFT_325411 [Annulohypoxylon truncatum]